MKFKFFLVIAIITIVCHIANAEQQSDTVWTKDLWQTGTINHVQFLPDSKSIAVATGAVIMEFDCQTGEQLKRFDYPIPGDVSACNSFCFTEDGSKLVTSYDNATIIVWDWIRVDTIKVFRDIAMWHIKPYDFQTIIGIGYIPPGTDFDTYQVYLFNINNGKVLKKIQPSDTTKRLGGLANFNNFKDKNLLAIGVTSKNVYDKSLYLEIWDLISFNKIVSLGTQEVQLNDLAFSSDGNFLASASSDGTISLWDISTKKLAATFIHKSMGNGFSKAQFSPQGGYLISSGGIGTDFTTQVWDLKNLKLSYKYNEPFGAQYALDISYDTSFIAIGRARTLLLLNSHCSTVGIIDPTKQTVQVIYPNPSGNAIKIPFESGLLPLSINISNSNGLIFKSMNQFISNSSEIIVDISNLPMGTYFVTVTYPNRILSYKFVKVG